MIRRIGSVENVPAGSAAADDIADQIVQASKAYERHDIAASADWLLHELRERSPRH